MWIENMNKVLDNNKKRYLTSGEIIKLSDTQTMIFKVQDLAVASPATVSRCGMVYLASSILGLQPFINCWLKNLPEPLTQPKVILLELFDTFLQPSINFIRTMDSSLAFSLMKLPDCFFRPFIPAEGFTIDREKIDQARELI